jgi:hypothetical protein
MKWKEQNKKRVRVILDAITATSSQAELARSYKLSSRSVLHQWYQRGQIPLKYHAEVIADAAQVGVTVTAGELHPDALLVERNNANAAGGTHA